MTSIALTSEQIAKLRAATKRYFSRVRSIGRHHRENVAKHLCTIDEKRVQAIKQKISV